MCAGCFQMHWYCFIVSDILSVKGGGALPLLVCNIGVVGGLEVINSDSRQLEGGFGEEKALDKKMTKQNEVTV